MKELHGVQTLHHEIHTNNIVYLQMLFVQMRAKIICRR